MNTLSPPRATRAREAVLHIFQAHPAPLSLAELLRYVQITLPSTAYSTVYRIVLNLERNGKVVRIDWRERGSRFEWAERPHHHHIICRTCGKIVDLDDDDLKFSEERIGQATGFLVKYHSIELEGICPACQKHHP